TDSGRDITMTLGANPDPETDPARKAALVGRTTVKTQNGVAVFDTMYIHKDKALPAAVPQIDGFRLQASAGSLKASPLSDPFPLKRPSGNVGVKFDADGNPIANFIPLPTITIEKPPANVPVNQPLSFSFKLTDPADPANPGKYMKEGNVLTKLL